MKKLIVLIMALSLLVPALSYAKKKSRYKVVEVTN